MATLNERVRKLEEAAPKGRGEDCHFPSLKAVASSDMHAIGFALEDGYWAQLTAIPEVSEMLKSDALTTEQGARLAAIANELMATEKPAGAGWSGVERKP